MNQRLKNILLRLKPRKRVFTEIYARNIWESDSKSGPGSELSQTQELIKELPKFFERFEIKSILDAPCGDFNWMQHIDLKNMEYIGGDIVPAIIETNKNQFESHNIRFEVMDIIEDDLPNVDLIIVRDCFVHFSYRNISKALHNIRKAGIQYIATTSFINCPKNYDIPTGEWRLINLQLEPFNFPEPLYLIDEKCTEGDGRFSDKSLIIWKVTSL